MIPQIFQLVGLVEAIKFWIFTWQTKNNLYTYSNISCILGGKNVFNTPDALLLALVHHLGTRSVNVLLALFILQNCVEYHRSMLKHTYRDSS